MGDSEKHPIESAVQSSGRAILERRMGAGPDWPGFFGRIPEPPAEVNGLRESVATTILDTLGDEAFPDISCVVIGVVSDAKAFLSPDRTYVYSDFHLKVEDVLKPDRGQPIESGDLITTYRTGGAIRFQSGHIVDFIIHGKGFPLVGGRYVLFLWRWNDMFGRYLIQAGYQLKDGAVLGLDDGKPYSDHDNMPQDEFLREVRQAVAAQK